MSVKQLKMQLAAAICAVAVTAVSLGSSTFAWYANNAQVTATNVSVTSVVSYSLLIKRAIPDSVYSTSTPLNGGTTLVPVSTLGQRVASDTKLADGTDVLKNDIRFVKQNEWNEDSRVKNFTEVGKLSKTLINDGVNTPYDSTLYYADSVFLKAGQRSKIYFDNQATGIYDSANQTLISFPDVTDPNQIALLKTMRVGLLVTQGAETRFYVYQFQDEQIDPTGANTYTTTINSGANTVDGVSYAAGPDGVGSLETNVCNLINNKIPVISKCLAEGNSDGLAHVYTSANNTEGKVSQAIATVSANEEIKVDIYFWMEGCDLDTTAGNTTEFSSQIEGIQFGFCLGTAE